MNEIKEAFKNGICIVIYHHEGYISIYHSSIGKLSNKFILLSKVACMSCLTKSLVCITFH